MVQAIVAGPQSEDFDLLPSSQQMTAAIGAGCRMLQLLFLMLMCLDGGLNLIIGHQFIRLFLASSLLCHSVCSITASDVTMCWYPLYYHRPCSTVQSNEGCGRSSLCCGSSWSTLELRGQQRKAPLGQSFCLYSQRLLWLLHTGLLLLQL